MNLGSQEVFKYALAEQQYKLIRHSWAKFVRASRTPITVAERPGASAVQYMNSRIRFVTFFIDVTPFDFSMPPRMKDRQQFPAADLSGLTPHFRPIGIQ